MATSGFKKASRELRPTAVALQKASMQRTLKTIARAKEQGDIPTVVGQAKPTKPR